jgi:hypothetical protein
MPESVERVAELLRSRNAIDAEIIEIIDRPVTPGHLGDWVASRIFGIKLDPTVEVAGVDGRFGSGRLAGATVNVKWYLRRESTLDVVRTASPDYYLVMTGPASTVITSRGRTRPWCIRSVFLFESVRLLHDLRERGVALGAGTSVRHSQWEAAEIYPEARNPALPLGPEQKRLLSLFAVC